MSFPWDCCSLQVPSSPSPVQGASESRVLALQAPNPDCAHPLQHRDYFNNPAMQETTSSGGLKAPKAPGCGQERGREEPPGAPALPSLP